MDTHSCERVYRTKTNIIHMELIKTIRMSATMKRNNQQALYILVGGLEHFLFFHVLGRIIPNDFHIFQRGRLNHQPVSYDVRWNEQASRGPQEIKSHTHRIHVCYIYIYGNIYHQYTPVMLAYIPAPWILWDNLRVCPVTFIPELLLQPLRRTPSWLVIEKHLWFPDTFPLNQSIDPSNQSINIRMILWWKSLCCMVKSHVLHVFAGQTSMFSRWIL